MEVFRHLNAPCQLLRRELNLLEEGFGDKVEGIWRPGSEPVDIATVEDAGIISQVLAQVFRGGAHSNDDVQLLPHHPFQGEALILYTVGFSL